MPRRNARALLPGLPASFGNPMKHILSLSACLFLLAGCAGPERGSSSVTVSSEGSTAASVAYSLPADPEHGALTHLAIGALAGAEGSVANGTAATWMFEDGTARVTVQLNIAATDAGTFYIAWIGNTQDASVEKLGTLANQAGDVRHSLKIEAQKDYKRYSEVFVTRESSEGVSVPSKIVANGILKTKGL